MRKAEQTGEVSSPISSTPPTSPHRLTTVTEASPAITNDSALYSTQNAPQCKDASQSQNTMQASTDQSNAEKSTDQSCAGLHGCDLKTDQSESPVKSPKPELPPRTSFPPKVDNSVDPVTGKQVSQSFYLEMTPPKPKDFNRPVSEVKPQISAKNIEKDIKRHSADNVDHYGILFPNLKKDVLDAPKKCELTRSNTTPDDSGYIGLDPISPTAKFKEKQGQLRRTNTAPDESAYMQMTNPKTAKEPKDDNSTKENEYSEITEKTAEIAETPESPKENIYATIPEAKKEAGDYMSMKEVSDRKEKVPERKEDAITGWLLRLLFILVHRLVNKPKR